VSKTLIAGDSPQNCINPIDSGTSISVLPIQYYTTFFHLELFNNSKDSRKDPKDLNGVNFFLNEGLGWISRVKVYMLNLQYWIKIIAVSIIVDVCVIKFKR
jgi:hypothetical protein